MHCMHMSERRERRGGRRGSRHQRGGAQIKAQYIFAGDTLQRAVLQYFVFYAEDCPSRTCGGHQESETMLLASVRAWRMRLDHTITAHTCNPDQLSSLACPSTPKGHEMPLIYFDSRSTWYLVEQGLPPCHAFPSTAVENDSSLWLGHAFQRYPCYATR